MKTNKNKEKLIPKGKVKVMVYENGDTEYLTPLPELEVNAYKSDRDLGENATYDQYSEWYLKKLRNEAADRAKFARIGFAPLNYKAPDTSIIEGDDLKALQRQFGDTIRKRQETGLYDSKPHIQEMDSTLFRRLNTSMSGFSCINSQTSYFDPRFANKSNIDFAQNPFGFIPTPLDSLKRGDIIQLCRPWEFGAESLRPFHAVMFDSYNENGDVNVWDQHGAVGSVVPDSVTYLYKSPDDNCTYRALNAFRFIGDQQTQDEIREGYEAYRERHNLQD